jgi:hypothetical protein
MPDSNDPFAGMRRGMEVGSFLGTVIGAAAGAYIAHRLGENYTLDIIAGAAGSVAGYGAGRIAGLAFGGPVGEGFESLGKGIAAVFNIPFAVYDKCSSLIYRVREHNRIREYRKNMQEYFDEKQKTRAEAGTADEKGRKHMQSQLEKKITIQQS